LTGFELEEIGITETSNELVYAPDPQFTFNKVAFGKQLADNLGQSFGVSLSVPIFNGYRNKMNVENAKVNTEISTLGLESTKNQVRADVTTAYTNLKAAKSRYDASLASEIAQEKNFEFSQARFDAGMMNSVDLLNAKNMWFQSQINTTNSKYEYIFRNLIIEFYQGNPLKL
jgi:outer membrane protein